MMQKLRNWMGRLCPSSYTRKAPLVLVNGLAEQAETWFRNQAVWQRHFDVHMPNLVLYEGETLHRRIEQDLPIDVDYLVEQLSHFVDNYLQAPPYHLVASSMGGKIAIEYAVRYPDKVARMVLICPSGLGEHENLPLVEGVRRNDPRTIVESVFFNPRLVEPELLAYYREKFKNRRWRMGALRTIRGTMGHTVQHRLPDVEQPTLLIAGQEDRIVDPDQAALAARELPHCRFICLPRCGHAPHIEKARLVNRLVAQFLLDEGAGAHLHDEPARANGQAVAIHAEEAELCHLQASCSV